LRRGKSPDLIQRRYGESESSKQSHRNHDANQKQGNICSELLPVDNGIDDGIIQEVTVEQIRKEAPTSEAQEPPNPNQDAQTSKMPIRRPVTSAIVQENAEVNAIPAIVLNLRNVF
jgi:hypothetical protein